MCVCVCVHPAWLGENSVGAVANVLHCDIWGIKFGLQSRYYIHFRTDMEKVLIT